MDESERAGGENVNKRGFIRSLHYLVIQATLLVPPQHHLQNWHLHRRRHLVLTNLKNINKSTRRPPYLNCGKARKEQKRVTILRVVLRGVVEERLLKGKKRCPDR